MIRSELIGSQPRSVPVHKQTQTLQSQTPLGSLMNIWTNPSHQLGPRCKTWFREPYQLFVVSGFLIGNTWKKCGKPNREQREHRDPWNHHQPRGANPSRQDPTEILIITNVQEVVFPNRGFIVCKRCCWLAIGCNCHLLQ